MEEMKKNLSLRVFKRNTQYIVLLWDKIQEVLRDRIEVVVNTIGGEKRIIKHFELSVPKGMRELKKDENTVICVIDHEKNDLKPEEDYWFKVKYGDMTQELKVLRVGVLPSYEREDRQKNLHLYLWDRKVKKWRKAEGSVDERGRFALLVSLTKQELPPLEREIDLDE